MRLDSLLSPAVKSILIKGEPGVGKTMLALELLKLHGRGVYVSTRVSAEKLLEHVPGMAQLIESGKILEARSDAAGIRFEDVRMGTSTDIVEFILAVTERIKEPLIVLDSWDAFAKEMDVVERLKMEKALATTVETSGARVVFVSEEPHLTTTDYLVDAVVVLHDEVMEGRRIRRIEWKKLRGSAITQRTSIFTLYGGRFTLLGRVITQLPSEMEPQPFKHVEHGELFSTSSADLDMFLGGGMRRGSVILLEMGGNVGPDWHLPLLSMMACNFILNRGCALILPAGGITPTMVKESVALHIPKETLKGHLRIAHYEQYHRDPIFLKLDSHSITRTFETLWREVQKLRKKSNQPCFMFLGIDVMEAIHGQQSLIRNIITSIQRVRYYGDILMLAVKHSTQSKNAVSDMATTHIRMDELDGSLILYSVKPPSLIHHVEYDFSPGYPRVFLTPIV